MLIQEGSYSCCLTNGAKTENNEENSIIHGPCKKAGKVAMPSVPQLFSAKQCCFSDPVCRMSIQAICPVIKNTMITFSDDSLAIASVDLTKIEL